MTSAVQRGLLSLYRRAARTNLLRSPAGRWTFETAYLSYKALFEARTANRLIAYVKPGTTVIDVGANIGFFTTRFAGWVGEHGRVLAIEPERTNLRALKRRLARHRLGYRVTVVEGVAAERTGTFNLVRNPDHPGDHRLGDQGDPVAGWALDDLVRDGDASPVSFIKIDVQGAELRVVMGALGVIDRDRPALLVEIDAETLEEVDPGTASTLLSLLADHGYAFRLWTRRVPGEPAAPEMILDASRTAGYLDVLCLPG